MVVAWPDGGVKSIFIGLLLYMIENMCVVEWVWIYRMASACGVLQSGNKIT